jgi:hypothetical protein
VIAAPPVAAGADHDSATWVEPGVAANPLGAPGTVRGVADAVVEAAPVPAAFTADTRNVYSVPLARPVTVADVTVDVPSAKMVQLVPPLEEYSTT